MFPPNKPKLLLYWSVCMCHCLLCVLVSTMLDKNFKSLAASWLITSLSSNRLAFRSLVRKYNCDVCFTPMIVACDFMRSAKARDSEFTTNESEYLLHFTVIIYSYSFFLWRHVITRISLSFSDDRPLIVQFAAHDAQTLADAACVVAPFSDGVDLNCGCPQRWQSPCIF